MKRNICDYCKNCKYNGESISFCFDVCGTPVDILREIEDKRNKSEKTETWNGFHAQITAPKGTFNKILNESDKAEIEDKDENNL